MNEVLFYPQAFGRISCILFLVLVLCYVIPLRRQGGIFQNIGYYLVVSLLFHLGYLFTFAINSKLAIFGLLLASIVPLALTFMLRFAYEFPIRNFGKEKKIVTTIAMVLSIGAMAEFIIGVSLSQVHLTPTGYVSTYTSKAIPMVAALIHIASVTVFFRQSHFVKANFDQKINYRGPLGFAVLVLIEIMASFVIVAYFFFIRADFFIHSVLNILFFLIAVAYGIVLFKYTRRHVSMTFKLIGLSATITLLCFNVFGYFFIQERLTQYSSQAKQALVGYLKHGANSQFKKPLYIFERGSGEFVTGDIRPVIPISKYTSDNRTLNRENDQNIFVFQEKSYVQLQFLVDKRWYLIGFDELEYRQLTHSATMKMVYLLLAFLVLLAIIFPLLVNKGILHPVRNLIDTVQSIVSIEQRGGLRRNQNELALLTKSMHYLDQSMREYQTLQERYLELESRALGRRRSNGSKHDAPHSPQVMVKVEKVKLFIDENFTFDLSREGLASSVNMSVSSLGKAFKHVTGKTIRDYLNELRVEKSCKMLVESDMPVIDIAYQVGFESLRTYNRAFRKLMTCSPSEFRNRQQAVLAKSQPF